MSAPPFAYFGGKTKLAAQIIATFPDHGHYVEPFAGSLSVLLAKPVSVLWSNRPISRPHLFSEDVTA